MDFYNFHNADFDFDFSILSASEGLYEYPFFGQTLAVEQTNNGVLESLENCWDLIDIPQPSPMIGTSTNIGEATETELVTEVPSFVRGFDDYNHQSHITSPDPHLLMVDQQPQPEYTGLFSQTYAPDEAIASGVSTVTQVPGGVSFGYRGENQDEPCISTFNWVGDGAGQPSDCPMDAFQRGSAFSQYHPSSGPARTGQTSTQRFEPYGTSCAWDTERQNAEAGPSTLVPSQTTYPTGGLIPETAADAAKDQTYTEEHEAPTTTNTGRRNRQERSREGRKREQAYALELRRLVKRWKGFAELPSRTEAVALALWYIQTVRLTVYPSPLLARGGSQSSTVGSEKAKMEQGRRMADRILFEALSRYYRLEQGVAAWNRPLLLKKVLEDLKFHYPPYELSIP